MRPWAGVGWVCELGYPAQTHSNQLPKQLLDTLSRHRHLQTQSGDPGANVTKYYKLSALEQH